MNFKEFTTILSEAKFRETPPEIIKQVKKTAEIYFNKYNSNSVNLQELIKNKKILSFKDNKYYKPFFDHFRLNMPTYFTPDNKPLNTIIVNDLYSNEKKKIKIFCLYGDVGNDYAAYSQKFEVINLYDENIKTLSVQLVESKILHEITHGFQEYKDYSDKYSKAVNSKDNTSVNPDIYYKEPIEYDTHLNEIAYNINEKYKMLVSSIKKAIDPITKKVLNKRLEFFLKELEVLISAPANTYFELGELTLPGYLANFEYFLEIIKDDKRLWTKFKLKLNNLYQEIMKDFKK